MPNDPRYIVRNGRVTAVGPDVANQINQGGITVAGDAHADITAFKHDDVPGDRVGVVSWEVQIRNETGADRRVWLGGRFSDATGGGQFDIWSAGQFVAATTTFTDDTTDAKDAGADDFALQTTTNDDGFLVGGGQQSGVNAPVARRFNCIVVDVTTAYTDAAGALGSTSAEHNWQYWNGSAWANLTLLTPGVDLGFVAQEYAVVWQIPDDWAVYADGDVVGTDDRLIGQYVIRYVNATAPDTAAADAGRVFVGMARKSFLLVPSGGSDVSDAAPIAMCSKDERVWMVMDGVGAGMECFLVGEESEHVGNIGERR